MKTDVRKMVSGGLVAACALVASAGLEIAPVETGPDRNATTLRVTMDRIGTLRPRPTTEIAASPFMIDCSTQDRDFVDFDEYSQYLVALGVKRGRLMAGWAKTEKERGRYDFAWLDRQVDWMNAHAMEPYLDMSYGNPIYPGAGGSGLSEGIPRSEEGLAAWDRWTRAVARHYKGRVRHWAMWNEPNNDLEKNPIAAIAAFNVRTAKIIREEIPDAFIHGLSLGTNHDVEVLEGCLKAMGADVKLFDAFAYHIYDANPDTIFDTRTARMREIVARLAPHAAFENGESGCPSEWVFKRFALSNRSYTETIQAKWDMRRMVGDVGNGMRSSILHIVDMNYTSGLQIAFNRKGLLRANADHTVIQVKRAFYAVQNVASVFDDGARAVLGKDRRFSVSDPGVSSYEFLKNGALPIFAFWERGAADWHGNIPKDERRPVGDSFETREFCFEWTGPALKDPVWVDLFTGAVHAFPKRNQIVHGRGVTFVRVPLYDSPCLLAERAALPVVVQ